MVVDRPTFETVETKEEVVKHPWAKLNVPKLPFFDAFEGTVASARGKLCAASERQEFSEAPIRGAPVLAILYSSGLPVASYRQHY